MKILRLIRSHLEIVGFSATHCGKWNPFNIRNVLLFIPIVTFFISTTSYLLFGIENMLEFANVFYATATAAANIIGILSNVLNMRKLFEFIDNMEIMVLKREYKNE